MLVEIAGNEHDVPLPFDRDRLIALCLAGSLAHGTHLPPEDEFGTDDVDVTGIVIPPADRVLGTGKPWEGYQGFAGDVDCTFHSLQKFVRLLLKGNPNTLGLLWLPERHILTASSPYWELRANRHWFSGKHVHQHLVGYARGQMKGALDGKPQGYMGAKRKELLERFGIDTKMVAHAVRLLRTGIEFMHTGEFRTDRTGIDAAELVDIKRGEWSIHDLTRLTGTLLADADAAYVATRLPDSPDTQAAEAWLVATMRRNL